MPEKAQIKHEGGVAAKQWVRLSVNIAFDVASALRELSKHHGSSVTEEVRRAISVYKFLDDSIRAGGKVLLKRGDELMEIKFL